MDLHKGSEFTLEELKRSHIADLETQDKYNVRYIQYWVNEENGMVFCLMEGPSKEVCAQVHREAHGDIACNIIQVEKGDYELLMGVTPVNEFDMVEDQQGALDPGYRVFVSVTFLGPANYLEEPGLLVNKLLKKHSGREVIHPGQEILAVFNSCEHAVTCARAIQSGIKKYLDQNIQENRIECSIAVVAGEPVTENEGLFSDAICLVRRLNTLAGKDQILISSLVKDLCLGRNISVKPHNNLFKVLTATDERLLSRVMEVAESRLGDKLFGVENFGKEVGMSRPQFYRRIVNLTEVSPNDFIKELRLKKAERLVRKRDQNISEIAYQVGFSNPSYFSKCFYDRFGTLPSQYLETA